MNMINFCYTPFRGIFGALTTLSFLVIFLYSTRFRKNDARAIIYDISNIITFFATLGVFFAADFFTLFFFFEIMSFSSFMWVAHRNTREARYAAGTYLGISIAGGMSMLMGLFVLYSGNSLSDGMIFAAALCMFLGFGVKAGAFPLHVWLPAAYTEAPAPAAALLSAVLSKTGIFGLILVTSELLPANERWGKLMLLTGVLTMLAGGIRGLMSSNFKTTLAYSSMSQIGFMLAGIGMQPFDADLAAAGTLLHIINHSLVKLILFMLAGVVFLNVGSYDLNKVRGFGRKKPFLLAAFLLAALGVGGVPLLNAYISKTLLHESISGYIEFLPDGAPYFMFFKAAEYLFIFSGGLTIAYMTKLFVVLFVDKNENSKLQREYEKKSDYMNFSERLAVLICMIPIPFIGILPNITAGKIAQYVFMGDAAEINYFSVKNLTGAAVSIAVGMLIYIAAVKFLALKTKAGKYREVFPSWLNLEKYVYRELFYSFIPFMLGIISRILDSVADIAVVVFRKTIFRDRPLPYELTEGNQITHILGANMEQASKIYCAAAKKEYKRGNYEHKLALKSMDIFENLRIIERSLSFGLFMFCVGLLLILIYLLAVNGA